MLRHEHTDDLSKDKSHMYGRSTSNQVYIIFIKSTMSENRGLVEPATYGVVDIIFQSIFIYHTIFHDALLQDLQIEGHFSSFYPHHV